MKEKRKRLFWVLLHIISNVNLMIFVDYNGERSTADMTKFLKTHGHQFIFKVSEKIKVSKTNLSKWNVDFDSFFAKVYQISSMLIDQFIGRGFAQTFAIPFQNQ